MVSFPVPYQTFEDRTSSPTDLEWETIPNPGFLSNIDLVQTPNPVILLCSICDSDGNPCSYGNTCTANRECHCTDGSSGPLCQIDPASDGKCDIDFNIPEFDYDGGDCCEATCTSSSSHACGELRPPTGLKVSIGYPHCTDPTIIDVCAGTFPPCYIKNSDPVPSIAFDEAVVEISGNGKTLVVAEPAVSAIRVFDQVDSKWVQRGSDILDGLLAGVVLAVASLDGGIDDTVVGYPLTYFAAYDLFNEEVKVYGWDKNDWKIERTLQAPLPKNYSSIADRFYSNAAEQIDVDFAVRDENPIALVIAIRIGDSVTKWTCSTALPVQNCTGSNVASFDQIALSPDGRHLWGVNTTTDTLYNETGEIVARLPPMTVTESLGIFGNSDIGYYVSVAGTPTKSTANNENFQFSFSGPYLSEGDSLKTSQYMTVGPLVSVIVSAGGTSAILFAYNDTTKELVANTLTFDLTTRNVNSRQPYVLATLPKNANATEEFARLITPVAVSDEGTVLVDATDPAQITTVALDRSCTLAEAAFRLSTEHLWYLDYWRLFIMYNYAGFDATVAVEYATCAECRRFDEPSLHARYSTTTRYICVPEEVQQCLMFAYTPNPVRTQAFGFAAYVTDETNVTYFNSYSEDFDSSTLKAEREELFFRSSTTEHRSCRYSRLKKCEGGESPVVVAHDAIPDSAVFNWTIVMSNKTALTTGQSIGAPGMPGALTELCLPSAACYSIVAYHNGTSSTGRYGLFVDDRPIVTKGFVHNQTETFGFCT